VLAMRKYSFPSSSIRGLENGGENFNQFIRPNHKPKVNPKVDMIESERKIFATQNLI
jgi:hypothetical protein